MTKISVDGQNYIIASYQMWEGECAATGYALAARDIRTHLLTATSIH